MDIRLKDEKTNFKFRVCAAVRSHKKLLVVKHQGNNFFCLPGGHVETGESTLHALKREIKEETGFEIKNEKLFLINELFCPHSKGQLHEMGFYYIARCDSACSYNDKIVTENDKGEIKKHLFKWADKKELKQLNLKPENVKKLLLKNKLKKLRHVVYEE